MQSGDRDGWLALMADDVLVEDPIGESVTNPDGTGVRGKEAVAAFYDANIGAQPADGHLRGDVPVEFADEIAYILVLQHAVSERVHGDRCAASSPTGSNDAGLITNLRGYWNMDMMKFGQEGDSD